MLCFLFFFGFLQRNLRHNASLGGKRERRFSRRLDEKRKEERPPKRKGPHKSKVFPNSHGPFRGHTCTSPACLWPQTHGPPRAHSLLPLPRQSTSFHAL